MKTLNFNQMEKIEGGGLGSCIFSMGLTTFATAAFFASAGTATPFLLSGLALINSAFGTSNACGWY